MQLTNNQIPFSEEAEKSYVGCLLQGEPLTYRVESKAFYSTQARTVYEAILKVLASGKKADLITVREQLETSGKLAAAWGNKYLLDCTMELGYSTSGFESYGKTITELKAKRDILALADKITKWISSGTDVREVLKDATWELDKVGETAVNDDTGAEFTELYEELCEFVEESKNRKDGEPLGFATGFPLIDKNCEGLQKGTVTRINAYSNVGKTRLTIAIIANLLRQGVSVTFFSTEVVKKLFMPMMVSAYYGTSYDEIKRGNLPDLTELSSRKLKYYDDKFSLTDIVYLAKRSKPQVVVIDFAQNIDCGYPGDEYKNMSCYAREIQKFAIQNHVAVLDLSQISNEGAKEGRTSPVINSKGSGALVASADVALLLTREYVEGTTEFFLNLDIKKNKYWGYGSVRLLPDFKRLRFEEYLPEFPN